METISETGEDFPRSRSEMEEWFATVEDGREFLDDPRWGDGFEFPACGHGSDRKATSVVGFVRENVAPMYTVYTVGLGSYNRLPRYLYPHVSTTLEDSPWLATDIMPAVQRIAALLKRWLPGTHQDGVRDQLQGHLDEFVFRFYRRSAQHQGHLFYRLLQFAVQTPPTTYEDITDDS